MRFPLILIVCSAALLACQSDQEKAAEALAEARGLMASRPTEAIELLQEATRLDPTLHEAFGRLAAARLATGDAARAKEAALRAVELADTAEYRESLGHAHDRLEEHAPALLAFERALSLDPQRSHLRFEAARLKEQLGRADDALQAYLGCIEADIRPIESRIGAAALLVAREEREESRRLLTEARDRAAEAHQDHPRIAELLARVDELDREAAALAAAEADPHDEAAAMGREVGILGLLRQQGSLESIFGSIGSLDAGGEDTLGGLMGAEIGEQYGFGGLGLSGEGAGGGGTGEGTIGLGNIGTIGHGGGGGSGAGYGRGAAASQATATVRLGPPRVMGSVAADVVRRVVRRHVNEIRYCYERRLREDPAVRGGDMELRLTVGPDGIVTASSATGGDPQVGGCVARAGRRWAFPRPESGIVNVVQPITFQGSAATP